MKRWDKLPEQLRVDEVREYYDILKKRKCGRFFKRSFDIVVSFLMLVVLSPLFLVLALAIKLTSRGPVFFRQVRVTMYGKHFRIFKFRTMVKNAESIGKQVTSHNDARVTKVGKLLRKCRLDEIPQLIDILRGKMTFVGTRPEVPRFVEKYTPEMRATLLMRAGVTSEASIYYKDEAELMQNADDADEVYVNSVLPAKMYFNLKSIKRFGFWRDIGTMFKTVFAVLGKNYVDPNAPSVTHVGENETIDADDAYSEAAATEETSQPIESEELSDTDETEAPSEECDTEEDAPKEGVTEDNAR